MWICVLLCEYNFVKFSSVQMPYLFVRFVSFKNQKKKNLNLVEDMKRVCIYHEFVDEHLFSEEKKTIKN